MPRNKEIINCTKEEFIERLYANHGNAYKTYAELGVPYSQYRDWRNEDPEFEKAVQDSRREARNYVECKLWEHIQEGDKEMIKFYLKTQGGYSEKKQIELKSDNTVDLKQAIADIKQELVTE